MTPGTTNPDLNLRILFPLSKYLVERFGSHRFVQLAEEAGIAPDLFDGSAQWVGIHHFESFLEGARGLMDSDGEFKEACTHRFAESAYGVLRFIVLAMSPRAVYEQGVKTFHLISSISRPQLIAHGPTDFTLRYVSQYREKRTMCLSRQAQLEKLPTLWGLPPAQLTESKCIAHGDDLCDYHIRTHQHRRGGPVIVGALLGCSAGLVITSFAVNLAVLAVMSILGAVIGYALELRRTNRINLAYGQEMHVAFEQIAREDAEARRELFELNQRQRDWASLMTARAAERSAALEEVMERVRELNKMRQSTLRGVSHDLRNPLTWLSIETEFLREYLANQGPQAQELLENHEQAVERMKRLLGELMEVAASDSSMIPLEGKSMDVPSLGDRLRKRLNALVRGRDVKVSVFSTREAPITIVTDALVFDRVVDNLLTNAAKYTARGSIVVEIDGTPGFLTLKVSDTGCGIRPEEIDKIFEARKPPRERGSFESYGVGLSVVVQLLDQIGGKLEVMSKEAQGATFWAHFPIVMSADKADLRTPDHAIGRVVTIRRIGQ